MEDLRVEKKSFIFTVSIPKTVPVSSPTILDNDVLHETNDGTKRHDSRSKRTSTPGPTVLGNTALSATNVAARRPSMHRKRTSTSGPTVLGNTTLNDTIFFKEDFLRAENELLLLVLPLLPIPL